MSIKAKEAARLKRQNEKLRKMYEDERQAVRGNEELSRIHTAYIGVLLKKLGAVKESPVSITNAEIKAALSNCDVRATPDGVGAWKLYYEESKD